MKNKATKAIIIKDKNNELYLAVQSAAFNVAFKIEPFNTYPEGKQTSLSDVFEIDLTGEE